MYPPLFVVGAQLFLYIVEAPIGERLWFFLNLRMSYGISLSCSMRLGFNLICISAKTILRCFVRLGFSMYLLFMPITQFLLLADITAMSILFLVMSLGAVRVDRLRRPILTGVKNVLLRIKLLYAHHSVTFLPLWFSLALLNVHFPMRFLLYASLFTFPLLSVPQSFITF